MPPIGLCYLASSLRAQRAEVEIVDLAAISSQIGRGANLGDGSELEEIVAERLSHEPRLVGVGPLTTASLKSTHRLVEITRRYSDALVVVGGPLCSAPDVSSVVRDYLRPDYYVAGDGERPICAIWSSITGADAPHGIRGVARPDDAPPVPHREPVLDLLPLPARDLLSDIYYPSVRRAMGRPAGKTTVAFLSRGCPFCCTFCAAPLSSGNTVRRMSSRRIGEEFSACAAAGYTHLVLYDDCLFFPSPQVDAQVFDFVDSIARSGWRGKYQLEMRCDALLAVSDEALSALQESGCRQINMGIEKAEASQLERFRKRLSPDHARRAVERLSSTRLRSAGTFIIGAPGETPKHVESTIGFALSLPLDFAQFNALALYPGTVLFHEVFGDRSKAGWLPLCLDEDLAPFGDILWSGADLPLHAIFDHIAVAYQQFYSASRLAVVRTKLDEEEQLTVAEAYSVLAIERVSSRPANCGA